MNPFFLDDDKIEAHEFVDTEVILNSNHSILIDV